MISPLEPQKNVGLSYMTAKWEENELLCQSGRWHFYFLQFLTEQAGVIVACRCSASDWQTEQK